MRTVNVQCEPTPQPFAHGHSLVFAYICILDHAGFILLLSQEPGHQGITHDADQYYSNRAQASIPLVVMTADYYETQQLSVRYWSGGYLFVYKCLVFSCDP